MVRELLETAGLIPPARFAAKMPPQLSGPQCQPVVTAGALACESGLIILREPVSMPDMSLRAGVLRLLAKLHQGSVSPGSARRSKSFNTRETTTRAAARRGGGSFAPRLAGTQAIRHTTALPTRGGCAT
jgi:hypothetical protein